MDELDCKYNNPHFRWYTIYHFHIDHNALVYPPKFCITIAFDFSWNDWNTQEKLEKMFMQFFFGRGGGVNKVQYGLCENGE